MVMYFQFIFNPITPGGFAEKRLLKLVEWFSGHCRAKTYHKAVCRSYTSRPSDPVAKYQLPKFGHAQKANFGDSFDINFSLSLLPSFFAFLASFFFVGHLVGFFLVGKVFRKAFRILGLGERKGRWIVEQDFHGNFQVSITVHVFCLFLRCP